MRLILCACYAGVRTSSWCGRTALGWPVSRWPTCVRGCGGVWSIDMETGERIPAIQPVD